LGFEHERIHLETSSVLFRETPYHLVQAPVNWPPTHPSAYRMHSPTSHPTVDVHYPSNPMIPVETNEISVDLGKPADFPSFGWDNEYGERNVNVPPFAASQHMITNGEFWHFVNDGGYRDAKYWSDDGWQWRSYRNLKKPFFWEAAGPSGSHEYTLRTIFEIVPMPWDWPVDVTYYEAKAYCNWKQRQEGAASSNEQRPYRLLTEAEHHLIRHKEHNLEAARRDVAADKVMVSSGQEFKHGPTGANLNLTYGSQNPVDYFAPSETGHYDTTGSAWEWTEDHFNPLKGFEVHHVYEDFSTPCFDGKHSMIVGGSFISTGDEASVFARFHFRPHFLQHSGFRLVSSDHDAPATHLYAGSFDGQAAARNAETTATEARSGDDNGNVYETDSSLHMYLGLHYPSSGVAENVPPIIPHDSAPVHGLGFPQRVVGLLNQLAADSPRRTALDIGCAVGGASFELAKTYEYVDAFDFSYSFVTAAKRMQSKPETVRFNVPMEAELVTEVQAVHEHGVTEQVRQKVNFFTGDACELEQMASNGQLGTYDGVIMSNLLCRLPDPISCLNGLPLIVNENGIVVMVTPFSWLTEFTPRSKWLGGFLDPVSKEPIRSKDVLQGLMEERGFEKIHEEPMPLIIREHQRKMQYIVSEATGWIKK
jgi:5-histidylcysteine sulfoxide synthase/putative 4-mercaptohistidine N1-methyltranferase